MEIKTNKSLLTEKKRLLKVYQKEHAQLFKNKQFHKLDDIPFWTQLKELRYGIEKLVKEIKKLKGLIKQGKTQIRKRSSKSLRSSSTRTSFPSSSSFSSSSSSPSTTD